MSGLIDDLVAPPMIVDIAVTLGGEVAEEEAAQITAAFQTAFRSWLEESIFPFRVRAVDIGISEPDGADG